MKPIARIRFDIRYRPGLFENRNLENIAQALEILIAKSNEQTQVINQLIKEVEILKQKQ